MGLFGGSSRSRTTTTQTSTTISTINNIDARQDNRQYIDNSFTRTDVTNIDARQTHNHDNRVDARQYIDARQTHVVDSRQDNSINVGAGAYYAGGNLTINEIDNGAVDAALRLADENAQLLAQSTDKLVTETLEQSSKIADDAFNIISATTASLETTTHEALDAAYSQSEAAFAEQAQTNLLIMGALGVVMVGATIGAAVWSKKK